MKLAVIICIDDEKIILESLKAELMEASKNRYIIETCENGEDALEVLEDLRNNGHEVPLVISDYIMPNMKGDELLKLIHQKYPKILKIMLTGQASTEGITNAVNNANLYRYISKPWDSKDLSLTISEALKSYFYQKELILKNVEIQKAHDEIVEINKNLENVVQARTAKLEEVGIILEKKLSELTVEQEKSESLLLNIFPKVIAERLKSGVTKIADSFEEASVIFLDIVDFTKISANTRPEEVVDLLNMIFTDIDHLADKHGIEKIKTIGDSYMAASGIPLPRKDHALAAAAFGMEIMRKFNQYKTGEDTLISLRMGIHCGPVVAGVIGEKKFIYDLWGDTVNTASRMEENGEPGMIQVTANFVKKVNSGCCKGESKDKYVFSERGMMGIKGKGQMSTWWLQY